MTRASVPHTTILIFRSWPLATTGIARLKGEQLDPDRQKGAASLSSDYDGIILGTGHNALVLQAYLARCGLRVLGLERARVPGGGLATVENPHLRGFRHNIHSFFHRAVTMMPWYRDLELRRHGAVYLEPDLNVAMILPDGRSLEWWTDFDRTVDSFAEFSQRDAAALRRWVEEFQPTAIPRGRSVSDASRRPVPVRRVDTSGGQHHGIVRI